MTRVRVVIATAALVLLAQAARAQLAVGEVGGAYHRDGVPHRFHGYVALVDLTSGRFTPLVGRPASCGKPGFAPLVTTSEWAGSAGAFLAINGSFSLPEREYKPGDCLRMIGPVKSSGTLVAPLTPRPDGQGNPALLFDASGAARIAMATARDVDAASSVLSGQWQGCEHPAPDCPAIPNNGTLLVSGGHATGETALPVPREAAPRTAVGLTPDGVLVVAVIEGRLPDSDGIDLPNLAALLIAFHAVDAVNLDGGGSSTIVYAPALAVPAAETLKLYAIMKDAQRHDADALSFTFTQRDSRLPFASRASGSVKGSNEDAPTGNLLYRPTVVHWGFRLKQ
jgi:Phosphodiester glycosidase